MDEENGGGEEERASKQPGAHVRLRAVVDPARDWASYNNRGSARHQVSEVHTE